MSTIIFENKALLAAVKKASVAEKDAYELRVSDRIEPKSGKHFVSLCTCNGSVQSIITVFATVEGVDSNERIVFPASFSKMVNTLAAFSEEDFKIELGDNGCDISCGGASVPLPLLESAVAIAPENGKTAKITMEASAMKKAVEIGSGVVSSEAGKIDAVRNAVELSLISYEGKPAVRIVSTNSLGHIGAGAIASVKVATGVDEWLDKRRYTLNSVFCKIIAGLGDGEIDIMLFPKQVLVRHGVDFYIVVPNAAIYPEAVSRALYSPTEAAFSVTVSQKSLNSAVDIAMLGRTETDGKKTALSISNGVFTVSSLIGRNTAKVSADEVNGEIVIGVDGIYLKQCAAHLGSSLTLYGTGPNDLLYLKTEEPGVVSFICPCNLDEQKQEEEDAADESAS